MRYNIFLSTYQIKDNVFNNLKRKISFYKTLANTFQQNNIYGATISKNVGFYEGKKENSYLLQIITDKTKEKIITLCQSLREQFNQDSILLQVVDENILVYSDRLENI